MHLMRSSSHRHADYAKLFLCTHMRVRRPGRDLSVCIASLSWCWSHSGHFGQHDAAPNAAGAGAAPEQRVQR